MCGIAGIFSFRGSQPSIEPVSQMCRAMAHRGPDAEGVLDLGVAVLGHRRLSIIDLSSAANQPFTDCSGRYSIVFNGEVYNFQKVKELLNYSFQTQSDTEVILAAYIEYGSRSLDLLDGMFAFAIWDRVEERLILARDRFGVKPLYYYLNEDILIFASEVRALLASGLIPNRLDRNTLFDYLAFQSYSSDSSPILGVKQLKAGHYMEIGFSGVRETQYWSIVGKGPDFDFSDEKAVKSRIRELLEESVCKRMVSDVPIGAFLSGGIDSSAIVALMRTATSEAISTFNIAFVERKFDESKYAEVVARKYSTTHHTLRLDPKVFLYELENALNCMDVPTADGINTFVVAKEVKRAGITVALSGLGGDELFAGYPFFERFLRLQRYRKLVSATGVIRKGLYGLFSQMDLGIKQRRYLGYLKVQSTAITELYPEFRRMLPSQMLGELIPRLSTDSSTFCASLAGELKQVKELPFLSEVSVAEYFGYTQNTLLKDTDQMSMASSLEVREPFFDHHLVNFVLHVPDHLKSSVYPKSLLVESLGDLIPSEVVHRRKQGFVFPWEIWLRQDLNSFCQRLIDNLCDRDFVDADKLKILWKNFQVNKSIRAADIWVFIVLEYWLEKNKVE